MLGDLGSNLFIIKTTAEEDKKRLEEIISDWAFSKGYERLPDEYMTRDNFEASEKAKEKKILYGKTNQANGERYIISYTVAREGLVMQFSLYNGMKTLMNETFTDTSVPISNPLITIENEGLKKTLLDPVGGGEGFKESARKSKKQTSLFIAVWVLVVIAIVVFVALI